MIDLHKFLSGWAGADEERRSVAHAVTAIAGVSIRLAELIGKGRLAAGMNAIVGDNADGDAQKGLDVRAHEMFIDSLRHAPVSAVLSEESEAPVYFDLGAPVAVAMDPLDGSSNVDTNVSIGTIFSVFPTPAELKNEEVGPFLMKGECQLAAGFVIYGPQTALVLTVGEGVAIFTLNRAAGRFVQTAEKIVLPERKEEYAINASNYRHWDEAVRAYIDECVSGAEGPRGENYNMRWIASLVAETYRIIIRGGIFMYPRDDRAGYQVGRLRLLYEANPIAFLIEQAGGGATDGVNRILTIEPKELHQRTPLVFGSSRMVERVARYHTEIDKVSDRAPLFGTRSVFR